MARRNKISRKRSASADTVNTVNTTSDDPVPGPSSRPAGRANKKKKTDRQEPGVVPGVAADLPEVEHADVITHLLVKISDQQATINRLNQQVGFLLSYLGITTNAESAVVVAPPSMAASVGNAADTDDGGGRTSTTQQQRLSADSDESAIPRRTSFAEITVRNPAPLSAAMKQAVVSAVYRDFEDRDRRNRNIVISGIPSTVISDAVAVKRLLEDEFGRTYEVVKCRRLGRPAPGKTQPVLATLATAAEAQYLVNNARLLRQSSDSQIRATVYINPDITQAEAFAAYQERCERRRRAASRPPGGRVSAAAVVAVQHTDPPSSGTSMSPAVSPTPSTAVTRRSSSSPPPFPVAGPSSSSAVDTAAAAGSSSQQSN